VTVQEAHVVEPVRRSKVQNERRVAVVLQDERGRERALDAVRGLVLEDAAEGAKRLPDVALVVRQRVEPTLHGARRAEAGHEPTLLRGQVHDIVTLARALGISHSGRNATNHRGHRGARRRSDRAFSVCLCALCGSSVGTPEAETLIPREPR